MLYCDSCLIDGCLRAVHPPTQQLKEEKMELQNKLEKTIYSVQQKSGFKNLLLEKKYEAMV